MEFCLNIHDCVLLGAGAEGAVYLSPEGYAIKIFKNIESAKEEESILIDTKDSVYFPNSILRISNILIREYVSGDNLSVYISKHGLSYKLAAQLVDLIEDFKKLNFKRLNIRNAHLFVNENEKLMVIDPRKPYTKVTPYPKDIIKILTKLQVFDVFLKYLSAYKPELLPYWTEAYNTVSSSRLKRFYRYG